MSRSLFRPSSRSPRRSLSQVSRPLTAAFAALTIGLAAGCASDDAGAGGTGSADTGSPSGISVVTSTNVYASIAQRIGGDRVEVEAILADPSADPHSFEATPKDQVRIAKAQLVIANGGGYDDFATTMVEAADPRPALIDAVEVSGLNADDEHADESGDEHADEHAAESGDEHAGESGEEHAAESGDEHADESSEEHAAESGDEHADESGEEHAAESDDEHADEHGHEGHDHGAFNEHVFYSLDAMSALGAEIAHQLGDLDPDGAATFTANAKAFAEDLAGLSERAEKLHSAHPDLQAVVTEPVADYLLAAAGISDVTPEGFSSAIESENDPSAKDVAAIDQLLTSGTVALVVNNEQTFGPVTEQVTGIAEKAGIPVVGVTETLPEGTTDYVDWIGGTLDALEGALAG